MASSAAAVVTVAAAAAAAVVARPAALSAHPLPPVSWIGIRLLWYPYLWMCIYETAVRTGFKGLYFALAFHSSLMALNVKWTIDLAKSKLRGWTPASGL